MSATRKQISENSLYEKSSRKRSLYRNRRRRKSSRSKRQTNKAITDDKKKYRTFYTFLRRTLTFVAAAFAAYLVYSLVEAENITVFMENLTSAIRG